MKTTNEKRQQLKRLVLRTGQTMTETLEKAMDVYERFLNGEIVERNR